MVASETSRFLRSILGRCLARFEVFLQRVLIHTIMAMPALLVLFGVLVGSSLCESVVATNLWPSGPLGSLTSSRQYHAQDGSGGYRYSFTGPHHAKAESSLNGITRGGYSYIDANGVLQTVTYTADDQNGFRVSASNMPQAPRHDVESIRETPEVAAAKKSHLEEVRRLSDRSDHQSTVLSYAYPLSYATLAAQLPVHQEEEAKDGGAEHQQSVPRLESADNPFLLSSVEAERIRVPRPDPSLEKQPVAISRPSGEFGFLLGGPRGEEVNAIASSPMGGLVSYVGPVLPYRLLHSSLRHTQDSLGRYDYSYTGDSSAKTESRSLDGTTRGAYSYIDPNGILQQVRYVADRNGFRVLATNLPEAK